VKKKINQSINDSSQSTENGSVNGELAMVNEEQQTENQNYKPK